MKSLIIALLLLTTFSGVASAAGKKPGTPLNNTDLFFKCIEEANKGVCAYAGTNWADPVQTQAYAVCYATERAKCGCKYNLASECK